MERVSVRRGNAASKAASTRSPAVPQHRGAGRSLTATVPPIVSDVLRSSGQPLDVATRAYMEPRFGHDFSKVRVHADARAAESAGKVNALGYTVGRHVVFASGQYAPSTLAGRKLLAHELTHVVQQSAAGYLGIQRQGTEDDKQKVAAEASSKPDAKIENTAEATSAEPVSDAAIDALDLEPTAKTGAQEVKKKHPEIVFTSGRRNIADQAHAMASNIVKDRGDREWIKKTYAAATELQKWVDDNPKATTLDEIAKGLEDTLNGMSESDQFKVSKHLSGKAFDVQPQTKDADAIKTDMKALSGKTLFLEKEGKNTVWHVQFKKPTNLSVGYDHLEREADRMAELVVGRPIANAALLPDAGGVAALQRRPDTREVLDAGSFATQRRGPPGEAPNPATRALTQPGFAHDFSRVPVHADAETASLTIGKPDDIFERQANLVANQIAGNPGANAAVRAALTLGDKQSGRIIRRQTEHADQAKKDNKSAADAGNDKGLKEDKDASQKTIVISRGALQMATEGDFTEGDFSVKRPHFPVDVRIFKP